MKRLAALLVIAGAVLSLVAACAAPTPEVIEKEVVVEKEVPVTVEVEKRDVVQEEVVVTATPVPAPEGPTGDVRFLIAENFWANWEPYQTTAQSQRRVGSQIYDALIQPYTMDLTEFPPGLATEWEQIDDTTWEFKLREGVKFHNGQDFGADDVKASIERASGASDVVTVFQSEWVTTTVEIIDDYTVRLHNATPFGPFLSTLSRTPIVCAEDLEAGGDQLSAWPNGTGPFRLVEDEPTRKVMEANLEYWAGPPAIKKLTWEFIQDPQTRLSALMAGQAHAIDRVPPHHLQVISGSPDLALISVTGIEIVNLYSVPGRLDLWDNNEDFRKAMLYTIDREALVRDLVQGNSAVATSFLPENAMYHKSGSPQYEFDLDMAREQLEAAGITGETPEFELWVASGFLPRGPEVVEAIADNMRQAGLNPKIVTTDISGIIDDAFSEDGSGLLYHISWSSSGDPHSGLRVYGTSLPWCSDATIDELLQAGIETADATEREAIYEELQDHMWDRMYQLPLYNSDFTIAHRKTLEGLLVLPNFETYFYPARLVE
jgi:peptide/nickel transport system substrate-binding protein